MRRVLFMVVIELSCLCACGGEGRGATALVNAPDAGPQPAATAGASPATSASASDAFAAGTDASTSASGGRAPVPGMAGLPNPSQPAAASGQPAMTEPAPASSGMLDPQACLDCAIPPECQGFAFRRLKYSPGGNLLPNKCSAFDATTNNPYAVRCIDAIPNFHTQFPGDQYCILPPPPERGVQVGFHPQGDTETYWKQIWAGDLSGYDAASPEWTLAPGAELTQNYRSRDANSNSSRRYYRTYFRMRTGSHHNVITLHDSVEPAGWVPIQGTVTSGLIDASAGELIGVLGGQQRPDDNTPLTLDAPPEDSGLYLDYPANASLFFNLHFFNSAERPLLREDG